eukprot:CAMPEP_0185262758 /NCGR_PEP_ID=MMETSP1359-20130426/10820_1 /TAXON_ID=552665 /ORGANISM="Bigelowiella longifila, Strain CCMP242" /LENGTH=78 /DNA_ID=CAMNT_0027849791 /DNA_START=411 /DNA_END=647 /DNA_ORIENTATION=+
MTPDEINNSKAIPSISNYTGNEFGLGGVIPTTATAHTAPRSTKEFNPAETEAKMGEKGISMVEQVKSHIQLQSGMPGH